MAQLKLCQLYCSSCRHYIPEYQHGHDHCRLYDTMVLSYSYACEDYIRKEG